MHAKRIDQLQKRLAGVSVPAVLISNLTNIHYLTGVQVSSGLLCITRKNVILFVDSRYTEMASARAKKSFLVADPTQLKQYMQQYSRIGYEAEDVTMSRLERWKTLFKNKKFVQILDFVEGLRRVKDRREKKCITEACAITKKALSRVPRLLRYGMTERDLALELYVFCMKKNADGMAFETIIGFGENTSKPHHRPSDRKLRKGDIVQIDMGVMYQGYCSDYSRVYFTAGKTLKQGKAYRALKEAKKAAERILKPGVLNIKLDQEARSVLKLYGYDKEFSHSLGHGVGMDIHEGVILSVKSKPVKLLKNEVVTIEPGLYFEGEWGMRLEDTYIVT